ncbi:MAG: hypothetical protein ACYDHW_02355 [Syntrophorhabdaceae bacterium]
MLIRYLPRKFDEKIPVPVQKIITRYSCTDDKETLIFEITENRKHEIKCDECSPLMSREKRMKTWVKLASLFTLLIAFCAGSFNIICRILTEGLINVSFLAIFQLVISLTLVGYITLLFKINIEQSLYGGISCHLGEIYFQSEDEKIMFRELLRKGKENLKR